MAVGRMMQRDGTGDSRSNVNMHLISNDWFTLDENLGIRQQDK